MAKQLAVIIGRFNPVHRGHVEQLIAPALEKYDEVLVLLGSSNSTRTPKNPFDWITRGNLLRQAVGEHIGTEPTYKMHVAALKDYIYNEIPDIRWILEVQRLVDQHLQFRSDPWEVTLVGNDKDDSSYYVHKFPQWKKELLTIKHQYSATAVREAMYNNELDSVKHMLFDSTYNHLTQWMNGGQTHIGSYSYIASWYQWENRYRQMIIAQPNGVETYETEDGPVEIPIYKPMYAPTYVTTDNIIVWRGHVLLIQRKAMPGQGLWALPGGFLNPDERIVDGALREGEEESRVRIRAPGSRRPVQLNRGWASRSKVFDYPARSGRGRVITTAFLWQIPDEFEVDTRAGDDAARAKFFPIYDVLHNMNYQMFEDHQQIIANMVLR